MTKYVIRRASRRSRSCSGSRSSSTGSCSPRPGGRTAKFANNPRMTQEQKDKFKKAWGLDQPIPIQYCRWMGVCNPETEGTFLGSLPTPAAFIGPTGWPNFLPEALSGATNGVLHGDFGYSINSGEKVERPDRPGRPADVHPRRRRARHLARRSRSCIGVYAAIKRYSLFDNAATVFSLRRLRDADVLARASC